MFLDETATSTNMTRRYGRARRGQRCVAAVPHGHWKTTTFVAGLRHGGVTAPLVIDGPMDGQVFLAWVRQFLCPTLSPGDIVIADNLASHKVTGVAQAIAARGASILYLPPYSPDLNPIEKMWSKVKEFLRSSKARSQEALLGAIASALRQVTAEDAEGWFASCGYIIN